MAKITKRLVNSLPAPVSGDAFAWDTSLKGFGVRVKPSGAKSFVIKYRNRQGVSRRCTFARNGEVTAEEARRTAARLLAEVRLGADPAAERREQRAAKTVAELVELYLADGPIEKPTKKASSWATDASNCAGTSFRFSAPGRRLASELA